MLIVEDGTGLANANSYVSLADADDYHLIRGNTVWGTLGNERKTQLLILAADYITYMFGPHFIGKKAVSTQALAWPRISITNMDLYGLGVPREVAEANAELALIQNTVPLMPSSTSPRKKKVKVGPIEVEYDANGVTGPKFVAATSRLATYLDTIASSGIHAKVVRT
jgi:hypothetical protein